MTKIIETSFIVSILLGLICNGLGPRIYTIQSSLGVWFDIDIKIIVDYGNDGMIKDGVNITVTGSRGYYTWIGIGFGTEMENAPAVLCANQEPTPQERQLGPPITADNQGAGIQLPSKGTGECETLEFRPAKLIWRLDGYKFANDLYTFPTDGGSLQFMWAEGGGGMLGYHFFRGAMSRGMSCQGDCTGTRQPTVSTISPTPTPFIGDTKPEKPLTTVSIVVIILSSIFGIICLITVFFFLFRYITQKKIESQ